MVLMQELLATRGYDVVAVPTQTRRKSRSFATLRT